MQLYFKNNEIIKIMDYFVSIVGLGFLIYLVLGIIFSILFLWKGVSKVDPGTIGSGFFFKVLTFPGMCFFWILFLKKWIKSSKS